MSVLRDIPPSPGSPTNLSITQDISVPNTTLDLFGSQLTQDADQNQEYSESKLNNNHKTVQCPKVCATIEELQNMPTIEINITPAVPDLYQDLGSPLDDDIGNENVTYFTGRAKPDVSPVTTPRHKNKRNILYHLSPNHQPQNLNHGGSRPNPYKVPPAELLKKRIRSRLSSRCENETPLSRRRTVSEPSVAVENANHSLRHDIGCVQVSSTGYHDLSLGLNKLIHLQNDFLDMTSTHTTNKTALISAIENIVTGNCLSHNQMNHSTMICWDDEEIFPEPTDLLIASEIEEKCAKAQLLQVLQHLNDHLQRHNFIEKPLCFNALEIVSMGNRRIRLSLKANSAELPLVIMHMGKERSLNAIPKKLNKNMLDVFDIKLSNFSVLSIYPSTAECTSIFLPEENDISNDLDIHIILVPRMVNRSSQDNVNLTPDSEEKKEHFSEKSAYKEEISTPKITQSQVK